MNQAKIGKFIAACRKERGLTQARLAERLNITDRAVSKWETGRSMPDSSIMLELCSILGISVNELLSGERIGMEDYNRTAEENLIELKKREEAQTRMLLRMEMVIGYVCTVSFLILLFSASFLVEAMPWRALMIAAAFILFAIGVFYAMKLEREAGYYECGKCGHRYVPDTAPFWMSMHMGRTRYMKCPNCGKWSWQKKVLTRE